VLSAPLRVSDRVLDLDLINEVYDRFGPIPRLCFDKLCSREALESYERELGEELWKLTTDQLQDLVSRGAALAMDSFFHKICLIKADWNNISNNIDVTPITNSIASKLAIRFRNLECREQIRLYKYFAGMPSTRGMTGNLFEAYCQQRFQTQISLGFVPMVRLPDPKPKLTPTAKKRELAVEDGIDGDSGTHRPQRHSGHDILGHKKLEDLRLVALQQVVFLDVRPSSTCEYGDNVKGHEIVSDVYYMPRISNRVAFNSFIMHHGNLYILQCTRGKQHDIKEGLLPFLAKCIGLPPHHNWHFIIIFPDDAEVLKWPVPRNTELEQFGIFSSVIALEDKKLGLISLASRFIQEWWYQY